MPGSPARPCPRYTASGSGRDTRPACSASPQTNCATSGWNCRICGAATAWSRPSGCSLTDPAKLTEVVGENLRELSDPAVAELLARLEVGVPRVSSAIRDLAVSERQLVHRRRRLRPGHLPAGGAAATRDHACEQRRHAGFARGRSRIRRPGAPQPGLSRTDRHHARRVLPQDAGHRGRTSPIW